MRRFNFSLAILLFVWVAAGFAPVARMVGVTFIASAQAQGQSAATQQALPGAREVPSRAVPVPDTVSPQMQAVIARPFDPSFNLVPQTIAEWKAPGVRIVVASIGSANRGRF